VEKYVDAASDVAPGSLLLPLGTSDPLPPARVPSLEHAASDVAIARNGINIGNYQFAADHFPLTFRQQRGRRPVLTIAPPRTPPAAATATESN